METYLVGGAVRDQLLGKNVQDRDWLVIGSTPEEMISLGYVRVGKDFPVFLHPETKEEYALARTERKSGKGYTGFEVDAGPEVTIEEDLARRDLTVNAIAMNNNGEIIDPYHGVQDLTQRVLRHVTDAFSEDPLRVLRVARFKARFHSLGFRIAPDTLKLMSEIANSGELTELADERVWVEIKKSLMEEAPAEFFVVLKECGALKILLPEVDNLFGVEQREEYHPEIDTGVHTMMVLEQAAKMKADAEVRFSALVHDLGKADTPPEILPRHIGHEHKSVKRVNQVCRRLKVPKNYQDLAVLVAKYHTQCHQAFSLKASTVLKLLESVDAFRRPERLVQFLQACKADALGRKGFENNEYPQSEYLLKAFNVSNAISAKPIIESGTTGPEVGIALKRKRTQAIAVLKEQQS